MVIQSMCRRYVSLHLLRLYKKMKDISTNGLFMARLRLKNGMAKVVSYEIPIFHLNKQEHIISTIALTLSRHLNSLIELFGSDFLSLYIS
jgi:hypothetical protein